MFKGMLCFWSLIYPLISVYLVPSFSKNKLHFCVVLACGGGGYRKRLLYAVTLRIAKWSFCGRGLELSGRDIALQARGLQFHSHHCWTNKNRHLVLSSSKRMSKVTTWDVNGFLVNSYLQTEGLKTLWELQPPTKGSTVFLGGCGFSPTHFSDLWKVEAACVQGSQGHLVVYVSAVFGTAGSSVFIFAACGNLGRVYLKYIIPSKGLAVP